MPLENQIELIKFFTLFFWILNAIIAGLILIGVGVIAWLCYVEGRQSKVRQQQPARLPQNDGRSNSTILSKKERNKLLNIITAIFDRRKIANQI